MPPIGSSCRASGKLDPGTSNRKTRHLIVNLLVPSFRSSGKMGAAKDDELRKVGTSRIMATKSAPPRPVPRLYLATPVMDDPAPLAARLAEMLAGADVAAVLLRLKE